MIQLIFMFYKISGHYRSCKEIWMEPVPCCDPSSFYTQTFELIKKINKEETVLNFCTILQRICVIAWYVSPISGDRPVQGYLAHLGWLQRVIESGTCFSTTFSHFFISFPLKHILCLSPFTEHSYLLQDIDFVLSAFNIQLSNFCFLSVPSYGISL